MSSPARCNPPFNGNPDGPPNAESRALTCYLVTSPNAKPPGRGVYTSWETVKHIAEGVSQGGGVKHSSYDACLPAWHALCDAGAHPHPPASAVPSVSSVTTSTTLSVPATPRRAHNTASTTPHTIVASTPTTRAHRIRITAEVACFAVRGGGTVHTSVLAATRDFRRVANGGGPATLLTTTDPHYAAHFAAGYSAAEARALADGEQILEDLNSWTGGNPPGIISDAARRRRCQAVIDDLIAALEILTTFANDSDSDALWEDGDSGSESLV
ncbi:hypothetical protein B0H16DRAFT_1740178 [Mycena metata]|uniref:Uncharacterized protein n=1 Tax=Mycena metata TaxID=1033252 RepID=A0AAD7HDB1_9AGAR|nr:hypothetical protein B0H16DRAFT_1740178 [Mycena metata]